MLPTHQWRSSLHTEEDNAERRTGYSFSRSQILKKVCVFKHVAVQVSQKRSDDNAIQIPGKGEANPQSKKSLK